MTKTLADRYNAWYAWAESHPQPEVLAAWERLRTYAAKHPHHIHRWSLLAHISALGRVADPLGNYLDDIPGWAIPGLGTLRESPAFVMRWQVIVGAVPYTCDAISEIEWSLIEGRDIERWIAWRCPPTGNAEFLGYFSSVFEALEASRS